MALLPPPATPIARGAGLLLAFAVLAVPVAAPGLRQIVFIIMAGALVGLGVMMLVRAGLVSFGHALFFACGAYVVAFGSRAPGADLLWLVPAAVALSALLGAVLAAVLTRYRDIFFSMLNLAFSMVGYTLLMKLYELTGGSDGVGVRQPTVAGLAFSVTTYGWLLYGLAAVLLALALAMMQRYLASPMGEALGAIKTNETRLEYLGISARGVLFFAYVASAALAGLGGALAALVTAHVTPDAAYWTKSAEFVFLVILGGTGGVLGPVVGAALFETIRAVASAYVVNAWQLIMGATLLAMILFAPDGVLGLVRGAVARLARRLAPSTEPKP